ncbi:hypothetical protein [Streptomyces sp. NPDC048644]|uniref:hypothetical protein n=1 Tax=Streptomyces sp. NPDC048644 TaxID=3365582 RepID=UPI003721E8F3
MQTRTFGRLQLTLPALDEPGLYLSNVTSLESSRGHVQDFQYTDASLRDLDLADTQLITGRITNLRASRIQLQSVNLHAVELNSCNLGALRWSESKLSRAVFLLPARAGMVPTANDNHSPAGPAVAILSRPEGRLPDCPPQPRSCDSRPSRRAVASATRMLIDFGSSCCICCTSLLYSRIAVGVAMELEPLAQLLAGDDEASVAALDSLRGGASYVVWDGASSAKSLAQVYKRRLLHTRRKGIETLGLERAVQLLDRYDQPVRLGQVKAADRAWTFMLFLTENGGALVACTGVRQRSE